MRDERASAHHSRIRGETPQPVLREATCAYHHAQALAEDELCRLLAFLLSIRNNQAVRLPSGPI